MKTRLGQFLVDEFKQCGDYRLDRYGQCMMIFFNIAEALHTRCAYTPDEWGYSNRTMLSNDPYPEYTSDTLGAAGKVMFLLSNRLTEQGKDY
jgi:hypothetical protein